VSTAASGRATTYAYQSSINGGNFICTSFGNQSTLYAGFAMYPGAITAGNIAGFMLTGTSQCELRMNGSGALYFTCNGTNLGAGNPTVSTNVMSINTWYYVEIKCIFATSATGTCEVRVNGNVWLTLTSVQNANTTAAADAFYWPNTNTAPVKYIRDFYVCNASGSVNNTYLGDITVAEIYPNAAGTNSAWTANPAASFSLTSVNTTGVYQGTITGGASNAYQGYYFVVTGFTNGANNGTFLCSASSATSITFVAGTSPWGALTTVTETHAGTATFQNLVQVGIHGGDIDAATTNVGTRPNGDVTYFSDSTTNDLSDWGHQTMSLTGSIAAIIHLTSARKDDAGSRQMAQITVQSGSVSETGSTINLGNSYLYYYDILETDPANTGAWTLSHFNAATFGVKEVT
jgi:hypothetical protein